MVPSDECGFCPRPRSLSAREKIGPSCHPFMHAFIHSYIHSVKELSILCISVFLFFFFSFSFSKLLGETSVPRMLLLRTSGILRWHPVHPEWKAAAFLPHTLLPQPSIPGQTGESGSIPRTPGDAGRHSLPTRTYFLVGHLAQKHKAGTWLGGKRDPGEEDTPWRTAYREFLEESGWSGDERHAAGKGLDPETAKPVYVRQAKMYVYLGPGEAFSDLPQEFSRRVNPILERIHELSTEIEVCRAKRLALRIQIDALADGQPAEEASRTGLQTEFDTVLQKELTLLPELNTARLQAEMRTLHWVEGVSTLRPFAAGHLLPPSSEFPSSGQGTDAGVMRTLTGQDLKLAPWICEVLQDGPLWSEMFACLQEDEQQEIQDSLLRHYHHHH